MTMLGKDEWLATVEGIPDRVADGDFDNPEEVRVELRSLGFDADEIDKHMAALEDDFPEFFEEE